MTTIRLILPNGLTITRTVLQPLPAVLKLKLDGEVIELAQHKDKRGIVYRAGAQ